MTIAFLDMLSSMLYPFSTVKEDILRYFKLVLIMFLLLPYVNAQELTGVQAEGVASLANVEKALARDKALENALRLAVEQAVGTLVESETVVENYQVLSDRIYTNSSGYVSSYEILSERSEDNLYFVKVLANVKTAGLSNDLAGIGLLMTRVEKPRIAVMISETNANNQTNYGGTTVQTSPISTAYQGYMSSYTNNISQAESIIVSAFRDKGFHVVDAGVIRQKIKAKSAYSAFQGDNSKASELANIFGADILIIGEALLSFTKIPGTDMVTAHATMNARAVRAGNGEIIASSQGQGKSPHLDPTTGSQKALQKASNLVSHNLIGKILKKWQDETSGSRMIAVTVLGVSSDSLSDFKKQLKEKVRGVTYIYEREFSGSSARLDLEFRGTGNAFADAVKPVIFTGFKVQVKSSSMDEITLTVN